MPDDRNAQSQHDEFYVGYLAMPEGHRKFVAGVVLTLFFVILGLSSLIVISMRDPGESTWDTQSPMSWTGTLIEKPYPMLLPDDQDQHSSLFVVSMGKGGAHDRLGPYFGHHVRLTGYELNRDSHRLIELLAEPDAIQNDPSVQPSSAPVIEPLEQGALTGEIIDGKCYLGAMKPGDGMGHRACATLCISGGIPPMFVAHSPDGDPIYYLLEVDGSTQIAEQILEKVGQLVSVNGEIATMGDIRILRADASDIVLID
jgi:hypothetical protein